MNELKVGQKVTIRIKNEAGLWEMPAEILKVEQYESDIMPDTMQLRPVGSVFITTLAEWKGKKFEWRGPSHYVFPVNSN